MKTLLRRSDSWFSLALTLGVLLAASLGPGGTGAAPRPGLDLVDVGNAAPDGGAREGLLLDTGWKFHLGDAASVEGDFGYGRAVLFAKAGESGGAVDPAFDDSSWRTLDLPHDWAVEQDFVKVDDEDVMAHGYKPIGRQFPKSTVGWYRKSFVIPVSDQNKRLAVKFDGVFRDSQVWLNGHYLGRNFSGYSEFLFDITDVAFYGQKNVLVLRVDAGLSEGWFYEGAGIYRHVWLEKYDPLHIPEYGLFVWTENGEKGRGSTPRPRCSTKP